MTFRELQHFLAFVATFFISVTMSETVQDVLCACGPARSVDPSFCPTKALFRSSHYCKNCVGSTCTRLSEQTCGLDLECEKSFGLSCDDISSTCKGKIHIVITNITETSAQLKWKPRKKHLPPPGVFFSAKFDGPNTQWNGAHVNDDGSSAFLKSLEPLREYVVKVMQDDISEVAIFRTVKNSRTSRPHVTFRSRTVSSVTLAWEDFGASESCTVEYRSSEAAKAFEPWASIKVSGNSGTVKFLHPGTGYAFRVKNSQGVTSEAISVFTEDGCVRAGKSYRVHETFFEGCDLRCVCRGNDQGNCEARCDSPFVTAGTPAASVTQCHQVPSKNDSCCVSVHCEHGKPGRCPLPERNLTSCPRDCNKDSDCLGEEKCCHSEVCGRPVCAQPSSEDTDNQCSELTCGPNTFCLLRGGEVTCECLKGYSGNPEDTRLGCHEFTPSVAPVDPGVCSYKDKRYPVGEEFEDGCSFRCHCTDSFEVECRERCAKPSSRVPPECHLIADPKDSCCQIRACDGNANFSLPRFEGCEFNGHRYRINEEFDDGCESKCLCDSTGRISCNPRCAHEVGDLDDTCKLLSHPKDPCCQILSCAEHRSETPLSDASNLQVILEQAKVVNSTQVAVGFIVRFGDPPSHAQVWLRPQDSTLWVERKYKIIPSPGYILDVVGLEANTAYLVKVVVGKVESNTVRIKTLLRPVHGVVEGCLHQGQTYKIGQTFDIGCEQKCVCEEGGVVECQNRCQTYVDLIGFEHCDWVDSPDDACCEIPVCGSSKRTNRPLSFSDFNITCDDEHGQRYKVGETFFKDCHESCICQVNGKPICRPIDCKVQIGDCSEFEVVDVDFIPKAPNCCPPVKCKNDNSCIYKGEKYHNFQQIPQRLVERCDQRCLCVHGSVQCEDRCAPPNSSPPPTLPCPPSLAYRGHLPGDDCCTHWICKDTDSQLKNVQVSAVNSTAVRVHFSLPKMVLGQLGDVEIRLANELEKEDSWESRRFSRSSGKVFVNANLQFDVAALKPKTRYVLQIFVHVHGMLETIKSGILSAETQSEQPTLLRLTMDLELTYRESSIIVRWRPLTLKEKEIVDGLRVVYGKANGPVVMWKKSELLHRDITSYEIEKVHSNTKYIVNLEFATRDNAYIISEKSSEILTPNDVYAFKITLSPERITHQAAIILLLGVPSPISKYITVVRLSHASRQNPEREQSFQILQEPKVYLDGLQPSTSYKVWLDAYLTNGQSISSNILEFRTSFEGLHHDDHVRTRRTLQTVALIMFVIGVVVLTGFFFAWNQFQLRRKKGVSDLAAYDNPSYKVEMTTMNNNSNHSVSSATALDASTVKSG